MLVHTRPASSHVGLCGSTLHAAPEPPALLAAVLASVARSAWAWPGCVASWIAEAD